MADDTDLKTLKSLIASDSPALAALLDGPNASVAISALGKALLGNDQAPLAEVIMEAQKGDKSKILAAEQDAQLRLRQNNAAPLDAPAVQLERDKARDLDIQNARRRQIDDHDSTNRWLAFIVSGAFFLLILFLIWSPRPIPPDSKDLLFALLGVVATGWANIIGFYFGSSAGSMQKSQTIDAVLSRSSLGSPSSVL